jgi:predicted  nucleic acid-binding Zn-ribbon protein
MDCLSREVYALDNYVCAQCDIHETDIASLEQQLDDTKDLLHEAERQIESQQETIASIRQELFIAQELDI